MVKYNSLISKLGLSTHKNQLEKRKAKYPKHFKLVGSEWIVSKQYAKFIARHVKLTNQCKKLKGVSHV